jgi:hypothetical protein
MVCSSCQQDGHTKRQKICPNYQKKSLEKVAVSSKSKVTKSFKGPNQAKIERIQKNQRKIKETIKATQKRFKNKRKSKKQTDLYPLEDQIEDAFEPYHPNESEESDVETISSLIEELEEEEIIIPISNVPLPVPVSPSFNPQPTFVKNQKLVNAIERSLITKSVVQEQKRFNSSKLYHSHQKLEKEISLSLAAILESLQHMTKVLVTKETSPLPLTPKSVDAMTELEMQEAQRILYLKYKKLPLKNLGKERTSFIRSLSPIDAQVFQKLQNRLKNWPKLKKSLAYLEE